jgi:hypothetical protein
VGIAHYMDNLEISIKKQIQNELIRSRNSMIKEIRRELFEKMTHAMRSQGVYVHIFSLKKINISSILILDLIQLSICMSSNLIVFYPKWHKIV